MPTIHGVIEVDLDAGEGPTVADPCHPVSKGRGLFYAEPVPDMG